MATPVPISNKQIRENLDFMELGNAAARLGWFEAKDIINTLHIRDLLRGLES